jgi:exodeoxyribonuclease-3
MPPLKIATWNVNGIRAREIQFLEWVERERPDVICLQEIKSPVAKVPTALCELQGYRCYWHGDRGYSGVGLHIRRNAFLEEPQFFHPTFDHETRIVTAHIGNLVLVSVYVPNGGKDFPAKMEFLREMELYVIEIHAETLTSPAPTETSIRRNEIPRSWDSVRKRERCSSGSCRTG